MSPATTNSRYENFVIVLLLMFPVVINSIKILGNLILLVLVVLGAYIVLTQRQNPFRIPGLKLLSWITVGYFLVMLVSILIADGFSAQFHHLGRKAHFLLTPLVALAIYRVNIPIVKILQSLKFGLIIIGVITIYQFMFDHPRPSGMINANIFGDIAVAMLFLSLVRIFKESNNERMLTIVSSIFGLTAIILSSSRGSWLSFIILGIIFLIIIYPKYINKYNKRKLFLFLFISIFLVIIPQTKVSDKVVQAIENIQDWKSGDTKFSSSGARMEMWKAGLLASSDAPFFGYGYRNANLIASKYATQNQDMIEKFTHLHNEYITNLTSAGLIGLASLLVLLVAPLIIFIQNLKHGDKYHYALMGVLLCVGYATFGFSHIAFGEEHVNAFYVLFLSFLLPRVIRSNSSL